MEGDADAGRVREYWGLYKYLRDRYADRVVLTFAQIEDLVGFRLPDSARRDLAWWRGGLESVPSSTQSDSWQLAKRRATANLGACLAVFEREA